MVKDKRSRLLVRFQKVSWCGGDGGARRVAKRLVLPFDETRWIIRIRQILHEEIELCDDDAWLLATLNLWQV
ncbi:hypothetical protein EJB05_05957 [Eragrostis curvula]|uniref:Uncharacterized protein n=1 Tax=Eragrostis curvula TaxID=38414 RepID=A0A5J9WCH3_9POAL|nr:hypothetical protein EJB05_05957 [Eragrostis curvula]